MSGTWKVILVILSLVNLWLGQFLTIRALPTNSGDDGLYVRLAAALLSGSWLGPYTSQTLAKGPFYSIYMALNNVVGLPLLLSQHLLYVFACAVFVVAMRPLIARDGLLVACYALLLFNPLIWADGLGNDVVREQIYVPLTILVLGCVIGLLVRHDASMPRMALWSVGSGLSLAAFWLTREEGATILPSCLLLLGGGAFFIVRAYLPDWRAHRGRFAARLALCILPFVLLEGGILAVSTINGAKFGVHVVVDVEQKDFLAAYGALARVDPAHRVWYVPVPKETRQEIYTVSPAFAELRLSLESKGVFEDQTCIYLPHECGEVAGGWWIWKFRDAVAAAKYQTPVEQERYYARLAREVDGACDVHALSCGPRHDSLTPPLHREYVLPMLSAMKREITYVYTFQNVHVKNTASIGTEDLFTPFRWVTRDRLSPTEDQSKTELTKQGLANSQLRVLGWAFNPSGDLDYRIYTQDGTRAEVTYVPLAPNNSPDLLAAYKNRTGRDYAPANNARFELHTTCTTACSIVVEGNGKELGRFPLDRESPVVTTPDLWFHIDAPAPLPQESSAAIPTSGADRFKQWAMNGIIDGYRRAFPMLIVLGLLAYTGTLLLLVRRRATLLLLVTTAVAGAIVVRFVLLAVLNVASLGANIATNIRYLAPVYPLILIFATLAIVDLFEQYMKRGRASAAVETVETVSMRESEISISAPR